MKIIDRISQMQYNITMLLLINAVIYDIKKRRQGSADDFAVQNEIFTVYSVL